MTTDLPNLAAALVAVQAELPKLGKGNTASVKSDKGNYSYRYADLADVTAAVLPVLAKHGLAFIAAPTLDEANRFVLRYMLMHTSGESVAGSYPLPSSGKPQDIGGHITYARRYALCSVTGLVADEDDDAQAANDRPVRAERHETSWDPAEQEQLRDAYEAEIMQAPNGAAIDEIGTRAIRARGKTISPNTFDHLYKVAATRRAELEKAAKAETKAAPAKAEEPAA